MDIKNILFSTNGRLNRLPYFGRGVAIGVAQSIITKIIMAIAGVGQIDPQAVATMTAEEVEKFATDMATSMYMVVGIVALVFLYPVICLGVKRLHDLNKSGRLFLLMIIPLVNIIFGLYLLFAKGTNGANEYGADPLAATAVPQQPAAPTA